ncbi:MAG: hypothetical protein KDA96_17740, partial [Planctomycetaceae bacterium]|nr:hypothetical protein [Planctomycetaceae bacterium]
ILGGGVDPATSSAHGNLTLNDGIFLDQGASITASGGNISIRGEGYGAGTHNNRGIFVEDQNTISTTGTGTISIYGTGGGTHAGNAGIRINAGPGSITTEFGDITLQGTGGGLLANESLSNQNHGILLYWLNNITSASGNISLTGVGGVGNSSAGLFLYDDIIVSTGGSGAITFNGTASGSATTSTYLSGIASGATLSTQNGDITLTGTGGSGTGINSTGVEIWGNVTSVGGNIGLNGTAIGGEAEGVWIYNGLNVTTQTGNLTVTGVGHNDTGVRIDWDAAIGNTSGNVAITGTTMGGANNTNGVFLSDDSTLATTGAGTITITGTAGSGNFDSMYGIGTGITISSENGDITLTGNGTTGAGTGSLGEGIDAWGSITSASGNISLTGTGSTYTGSQNYGIYLWGDASVTTGGTGSVSITGTAGTGGGNQNTGLALETAITTIDDGSITIFGTGGIGSGTDNLGVFVTAPITSTNGTIHITGVSEAGDNPSNFGIALLPKIPVNPLDMIATTGAGADIILTADTLSLGIPVTAADASSRVVLENYSAGVPISVHPTATILPNLVRLNINTDMLDLITAGTLVIGNSTLNSGDINVTESPNMAQVNGLTLYSGGDITINASIDSSNGAASGDILAKAIGNISLESGNAITTIGGDVTFWSDADATDGGMITVGPGASISTLGGNITLGGGSDLATGYATANMTSGGGGGGGVIIEPVGGAAFPDAGVLLDGALLNAGAGSVTLRGRAIGDAVDDTHGVAALNGSLILGAATEITGLVDLAVDGAAGTSGVYFNAAAIVNTGDVTIQGVSNDTDTNGFDTGVEIDQSDISTSGGDITLTGTGRSLAAGEGVWIYGGSHIYASGDVSIVGQGSTQGASWNWGVEIIDPGTQIYTTNGGTISITGTGGGSGASPDFNIGVLISEAQIGKAVGGNVIADGDIIVQGTSGPGTPIGIAIGDAQFGDTGYHSDITLRADSLSVIPGSGPSNVNTDGVVTIEPVGTSFDVALDIVGSDLLINSLASELNVGKVGNTSDIELAGTTISGDINVWGGSIGTTGAITSNGGNILLDADTGGFVNIAGRGLAIANDITTTDGNIVLHGRGGIGDYAEPDGITISSGATISAGGTGSITATGIGGYAAGLSNENGHGINVVDGTLQTNNGSITLTGTGNSDADSDRGVGIVLEQNAAISAGGTGAVNITGTGSTQSALDADGVRIVGATANAVDGDVTIVGVGAANGTGAAGVTLDGAGILVPLIQTDGGDISITGTGASGNVDDAHGINFVTALQIGDANTGNLTLRGIAGTPANPTNFGIMFDQAPSEVLLGGTG